MKTRQAMKIINNDYGLIFKYKKHTILKADRIFQKKCKLKKWSELL